MARGEQTTDNFGTLWVQLKLARGLAPELEEGLFYDDVLEAGQQALVRIAAKYFGGEVRYLNSDVMALGKAVDLSIAMTKQFSRLELMKILRAEMNHRGMLDEFNKKEMTLWVRQRLNRVLRKS